MQQTRRFGGSSPKWGRSPRRTRLWSSTRSTEIGASDMSLLGAGGHGGANQRAPGTAGLQVKAAVHQGRALTHGNQARALDRGTSEANAAVFHLEHYGIVQIAQTPPRTPR